ncbi:hypothetical protein BD324DRAFT_624622 [Kockovaella imperatae]|uniref:DUF159-domain-containing protein n=1 Tax=Kockovaella imperatae TaxID=4999 RepID=A0A1Y1UHU3_9TREE|nr:hypothetical protein BD324DRAFT_624622 [Kockovaella imperatae]ORX37056.1 hypothetical protein BD324DRAFT_624622 [Kockovaella imperatae]
MCGRYALALSNEELYDGLQNQLPQLFQRGRPRWEREQDYRPNYNVAPRQRQPIIHRDRDSGEAVIETMQWGLIPHWTKHPPSGPMNTINARSESLLDPASGGMWHALKGYKRCIIPAQGYYEWQKKASSKVAHFTRLPLGKQDTNASPPLMFFAGLYDTVEYVSPVESRFQPREGDDREPYPTGNPIPLSTYTILTTVPAKDISWLHDRMPCILKDWEDIERWLDLGKVKGWEDGKGGTGSLLKGTQGLDCFPVPPEVGKIGTNSPTYIQPVSERSDGIKSFFQKQTSSPAKKTGTGKSAEVVKKEDPDQDVKPTSQSNTPDASPMSDDVKPKVESKLDPEIGDDSNAPNEAPPDGVVKKEAQTPGKRKRGKSEDPVDEDAETTQGLARERKGGHQTKVTRKSESEGSKEQPSITAFFK